MSDLIGVAVGSATGALVESVSGGRRERARDERQRRRESAARLLQALRPLHRRMRKVDFSRNPDKWAKDIQRALRAIEAERPFMPEDWRHIYRSVRDAVGTATGLGWKEVFGGKPSKVASFDSLWIEKGAGYLGYVIYAIEDWQSHYKESSARRIKLLNFDGWLAEVERRAKTGP